MAKKQRRWVYKPSRLPTPKVPDALQRKVEAKASELIETVLKPKHVTSPPADEHLNYIIDIYSKWYRNYFYLCSKHCSPGPDAISPFFEGKFARLEYIGNGFFNLSYMRHTGQWWEIYTKLSVDDCFAAIINDPLLMP